MESCFFCQSILSVPFPSFCMLHLALRAWMALLHQIKITSSFFIFFICHFLPLPLSPFFILNKIFSTRPIRLGSFVHPSIVSVSGHRELPGLCSDGVPSGRSSRITKGWPSFGSQIFLEAIAQFQYVISTWTSSFNLNLNACGWRWSFKVFV